MICFISGGSRKKIVKILIVLCYNANGLFGARESRCCGTAFPLPSFKVMAGVTAVRKG